MAACNVMIGNVLNWQNYSCTCILNKGGVRQRVDVELRWAASLDQFRTLEGLRNTSNAGSEASICLYWPVRFDSREMYLRSQLYGNEVVHS